jgi:hypothetical protein
MGPFRLNDLTGLDLSYDIFSETIFDCHLITRYKYELYDCCQDTVISPINGHLGRLLPTSYPLKSPLTLAVTVAKVESRCGLPLALLFVPTRAVKKR